MSNVAERVAGTVLYKGYVEKIRKSERLFVCKPNDLTKSHLFLLHHLGTLLFMAEHVVWEVDGQRLWRARMLKQAKQICQVIRKDTT